MDEGLRAPCPPTAPAARRRPARAPRTRPTPRRPAPPPDGAVAAVNRAEPDAANARWRALLAEGGTDPRRRRDGHDAVRGRAPVRRPARGLERQPARGRPADPSRLPRRRLADRDDEHVRRQPPPAAAPRARRAGHRAEPDRGDPRSARRSTRPAAGRSSPATSGRPARSWRRSGRSSEEEAVEVFAEQAAALIAGGVDVIWIETMSHLSEIRAAIQGVRQVSRRDPDHRDDDVRHPRPHDDGRLAGAGGAALAALGRRRDRRQLRQRPGRAPAGHRADARRRPGRHARRQVERRDAGARRHAGRLPGRSADDGRGRARASGPPAPGSSGPAAAARRPTSRRWPRRSPSRAELALAERVGFEPTDLSVNGFQDRRIRPLCHLSAARGYAAGRMSGRAQGRGALDDDRSGDQVVPAAAARVDEDPDEPEVERDGRHPQPDQPQDRPGQPRSCRRRCP